MQKRTIRDIEVAGKRVLVRVDFNVPQDDSGAITDDTRIRAALPTIRHLIDCGARTVLVSHLGRPKGFDDALRMDPVSRRLQELLGRPVQKANDVIGPEVEQKVAALKNGDVLLLENVRFYPEEEKNDPSSRASWPRWRISTSTTPSGPPIEHTPPLREWRTRCRQSRGS